MNITMDDVKEKLSKIFPNSEIIIKIEKSHDYRLNGKYAGVYIDGARMSLLKEYPISVGM